MQILRHFSPIATNWFQGSALEPNDLQALPAESSRIRGSLALRSEAERGGARRSLRSSAFPGRAGRARERETLLVALAEKRTLFAC